MQVKPRSARCVGKVLYAADFNDKISIGVREFHLEVDAVVARLEMSVQGQLRESRGLLGIEDFFDSKSSFRGERAVRQVCLELDVANSDGRLGELG